MYDDDDDVNLLRTLLYELMKATCSNVYAAGRTDSKMTEQSPILMTSSQRHPDVARSYTDESDDSVLLNVNGRPVAPPSRLDVLFQERITLSWTNLNVYVLPDTQDRCCQQRTDHTQYKQILYNGSSSIDIMR